MKRGEKGSCPICFRFGLEVLPNVSYLETYMDNSCGDVRTGYREGTLVVGCRINEGRLRSSHPTLVRKKFILNKVTLNCHVMPNCPPAPRSFYPHLTDPAGLETPP